MAFDAITMIRQAEETAKRERAQALTDARAAEDAAVEAGKAAIEEAAVRARKEIQAKLAELEAEGKLTELSNKYFGTDISKLK
jgi:hypothetical protein